MKLTLLDTSQVFIHQAEVVLERFQFRYSLANHPLELGVVSLKSNEGMEMEFMRNFLSEIQNKLVVSPSLASASSDLSKKPTISFMFWGRLAVPLLDNSPTTVAAFEIVFVVSTAAFTWLWKHYKEKFNFIVELGLENNQKIRLDGFGFVESSIKDGGIPKYKMTARYHCPAQYLTSKSELKASLKVEVELKGPIINTLVLDHHVLNKEILLNQIQCDFKIITEDDQVLQCHKVFLASRSKVFAAMFSTSCEETTNNQVKLPISHAGADAFLKYLYYSDIEVAMRSPTLAMDLLELGHKYDIYSLEISMKRILLGNDNWWYSADNALRLFDWSCKVKEHNDLKEKALDVIRSKGQELLGSDRFQHMFPNPVGAELCISFSQSSSD
ncbi:unnamed protein product [Orchesella dallaii]|uniref:BTB domain-containing protein n=1 Tax=Orchesella dallaii TaxID=48710 RepID=A0ABP1RPF6_9HEXA